MDQIPQTGNRPAREKSNAGMIFGILSILFGLVGLFALGLLFFPLSLLCAIGALWKRNFILGGIGVVLALAVLGSSPSIWWLIWGAKVYNEETQKHEQVQEIAKKIATQKQQDETAKKAAIEKAGKDGFSAIDAAFKESDEKGVTAFGKTGVLALFSMANDPETRQAMTPYKEPVKAYLAKLPVYKTDFWTGIKGSASDIATQLKYNYFAESCARSELKDENEKQLYAHSLGTIEDAISALEKGRAPEYAIRIRTVQDGKSTPSDFVVEKNPDGSFVIHKDIR